MNRINVRYCPTADRGRCTPVIADQKLLAARFRGVRESAGNDSVIAAVAV